MIPTFPEFKRLELPDRLEIEQFTSRHPPYSDYNFVSLWCWDVHDRVLLSQLHDHLIVRFTEDVTGVPFYSFIGSNGKLSLDIAEKLLIRAESEGLVPELRLIPEDVTPALDQGYFQIEEDRDNHDYIISLDKTRAFQGNSFLKQRCQINYFKRKFPNARIVHFELKDKFTQRMIERVSATWTQNKGYSVSHEEKAMNRLFILGYSTEMICLGVYIKNDLVAFKVTEIQHNGYAIGHFWKADTRLKGLSHFFHQAEARILNERGSYFINIEQDLGIPGLRMAKTALRPVHFLRKYKVSKV
jgi:uncharacterized protein